MSSREAAVVSSAEHLQAYVDGLSDGDMEQTYGALDDSFVLYDPDCGEIPKADYKLYFTSLSMLVSRRGGDPAGKPFLEMNDLVFREEDEVLTAWARWRFPGTDMEGASLLRVGPTGLLSEQLFNKSPSHRR